MPAIKNGSWSQTAIAVEIIAWLMDFKIAPLSYQ
jgi:hypothetical protein